MARGSLIAVLAISLLVDAFCLPHNINRFNRDISDNEVTDAKEVSTTEKSTNASSSYTPNPFDDDDDDDDDFPETTNTSSSGGGSNIFSLLNFLSALLPSSGAGGSNMLIRNIVHNITGHNGKLKLTPRCRDTKEIISGHRSKRESLTRILQRQDTELNSIENSESESSSNSDSKSSSSGSSESKSSSSIEKEPDLSSESKSSSKSESKSSPRSSSGSKSSSRSESASSSSSSSSESIEENEVEQNAENNNVSEENNAAEESVENNDEGISSQQNSDDSNGSDYDEPPGGDGQGGGLLGLLAGLSGAGNEDTDLASILSAVSAIVINLSGDGFDLNDVITSAVGLFAGLLSKGEENPGSIVANYLITALGTITGGGANNNGAFFGKFISKLLKGISVIGDSEESSEESNENEMTTSDSFAFFSSLLMGLLGDMSKGSSGGNGSK